MPLTFVGIKPGSSERVAERWDTADCGFYTVSERDTGRTIRMTREEPPRNYFPGGH